MIRSRCRGEAAIVKPQFQSPLPDRFFHVSRFRVAALREVKLMDDLLRDFFDGPQFRVHQHVGLTIIWLTRGEQAADFYQRIGIVEQGTMRLMPDALPDFFRRSPETDDQRVSFQTREVIRVHRQATTSGNQMLRLRGEFLDDFGFELAKSRFSILGENFRDRFANPGFNQLVRIQKCEVQRGGGELAYRGFAGAHEANEGKVVDLTRAAHRFELADSRELRTQKGLGARHREKITEANEGNEVGKRGGIFKIESSE